MSGVWRSYGWIGIAGLVLAAAASHALTSLVQPIRDDEVVEVLPPVAGDRAELRELRRAQAAQPHDARLAVRLAQRYLDIAHLQGDPRWVGQALATLSAWPDPAFAPDEVLLMRATLQQYLHDFDGAAALLELLVKRNPAHAQAWLTLATVRRVQGRYAASDVSCKALASHGPALYARACSAENDSLRGDFDGARRMLHQLLADTSLPTATQAWLLTTLAESEARAGRAERAETAYRKALTARPDGYTALSFADFLSEQQRYADALRVLRGQPRSDAVLLRVAIAGRRTASVQSEVDVREVRERMRQASLRPGAEATHAREQAMFALLIDADTQRALKLARENVLRQREPLDLWLLAKAAAAAEDPKARHDAAALAREVGLRDVRLDALR